LCLNICYLTYLCLKLLIKNKI